MPARPKVTQAQARRIALSAQGLDARRDRNVMDVVRRLGCIQFDPLNVVARTQHLVLFSRLGDFDPHELDRSLFESRELFHYWAHAASIVLTEDFPIHNLLMRTWPGTAGWGDRVRSWMRSNDAMRRHILHRLKTKGPSLSRDFEDRTTVDWMSTGWTSRQNVSRMLDFLWTQGRIMIAGREGGQRVWAHSDDWFPDWTPRDKLPTAEIEERVTVKALRALGVATPKQIAPHFVSVASVRSRSMLDRLTRSGEVLEVEVTGRSGTWLIHRDDLELLEASRKGWRGRTTILSPFDNLIRDRERTKALFDLDFTIEIYVPKAKRRYGYYVLPVVHGDRIAGLVDPQMDRKSGRLVVNSVHPHGDGVAHAARVRKAVEDLATWRGASDIEYRNVPSRWAKAFR